MRGISVDAVRILIVWTALVAANTAWSASPLDERVSFDIRAQPLESALLELSRQSAYQIVFSSGSLTGVQAPAVSGTLPVSQALKQLLAGTQLEYKLVGQKTITVGRPVSAPSQGIRQTVQSGDSKEGKTGSSREFRVAQVDQTPSGPQVTEPEDPRSKRAAQLEEVIVTGSRLKRATTNGPQPVDIFTLEDIDRSGQSTIADYLNTLPAVSAAQTESAVQSYGGTTTVTLHGLPLGTTLVLINGRRVEGGGLTNGGISYFDLNSIPLSAVERIEVVAEGSSAVYGSDALAGIVNVVLKQNFDGVAVNARHGFADDTDETGEDITLGKHWADGSAMLIGSYYTRSELSAGDRSITANADYTRFGGNDERADLCNPGNIYSPDGSNLNGLSSPYAGVPNRTGTATISSFLSTAGLLNKCTNNATLIPATRRSSVLASGNYQILPSVEVFAEMLFSRVEEYQWGAVSGLSDGAFGSNPVPASNPYNPFGETVDASYAFTGYRTGVLTNDDYMRPLIGFRGRITGSWDWEIAGWQSTDRDHVAQPNQPDFGRVTTALSSTSPSTALNVFTAGPQASSGLIPSLLDTQQSSYSGRLSSVNGFIRGTLLQMGSGPLDVVFGGEYDHSTLDMNSFGTAAASYSRESRAVFGEGRIPIIGNLSSPSSGDVLAANVALRYDRFSDFGDTTTPQFGVEWRPVQSLLIRASYGKSFRAPQLLNLYLSPQTFTPFQISDPLRGGQVYNTTVVFGGNSHLRPETGQSKTFGFVYSSTALAGFDLSVTYWGISEHDPIATLNYATLLSDPMLFPGTVVRGPSVNGEPGLVQQINDGYGNFGALNLKGLDYQLTYKFQPYIGELTASVSAVQTFHYTESLVPGSPTLDAASIGQDSGDWAPHWKGTFALAWKLGAFSAAFDARYTGRYQDYDSTRNVGNFWLCDFNARYSLAQALSRNVPALKGAYVEFGGVNLFNRLPQYSNYFFGQTGYDPSQSDIRGRFLYIRAGLTF